MNIFTINTAFELWGELFLAQMIYEEVPGHYGPSKEKSKDVLETIKRLNEWSLEGFKELVAKEAGEIMPDDAFISYICFDCTDSTPNKGCTVNLLLANDYKSALTQFIANGKFIDVISVLEEAEV